MSQHIYTSSVNGHTPINSWGDNAFVGARNTLNQCFCATSGFQFPEFPSQPASCFKENFLIKQRQATKPSCSPPPKFSVGWNLALLGAR